MSFVKLPEGGRIEVELDADQVEAYVRDAIDREVRRQVERALPSYRVYEMARDQSRDLIRSAIDAALCLPPSAERPHESMAAAVQYWLDRREGWVARQIKRAVRAAPK